MCISICGAHHGGRIYGYTFSLAVVACSGNLATMFSRLDMNLVGDPLVIACCIHFVSGCLSGRIRILVKVRSTFFCSRNSGGSSAVSNSSAAVGVVLKHPVIAFIVIRGIVLS